MGRPRGNGGPSFRFNSAEVSEMEDVLQAHNLEMPDREILSALAEKFSSKPDRVGREVHFKKVYYWFNNRRYNLRSKASAQSGGASETQTEIESESEDGFTMEFEARYVRDGAWYDVEEFLSYRDVESGDPEVLVRLGELASEVEEWVNVPKDVRERSIPCQSTDCTIISDGDLILCFKEGKEEDVYYDAHILHIGRRRHDVRGCRCRFLVQFDHDHSKEIVPLRKICRRPETEARLQQLRDVDAASTSGGAQHGTSNPPPPPPPPPPATGGSSDA